MTTSPQLGEIKGVRVRITGLVQGVGFRPFVWRLAHEEQLFGTVLNDAAGVEADIWGEEPRLSRFLERLQTDLPPLARITSVDTRPIEEAAPDPAKGFLIVKSVEGAVSTGIVPDATTCPSCLLDVKESGNRREGYAFTNCTHCGPRLSIIKSIPYDRDKTSMAHFVMCAACRQEYENPADRRFHAQPNACPICGPRLWAETKEGEITLENPLQWAAAQLVAGRILAIKGLGGFHLAVDASNESAVAELRLRKKRPHKPLALMARDTAQIKGFCHVDEAEEELLKDSAAPIVLLQQRAGHHLADGLAPGQSHLGVMLPYTPLHHLLLSFFDGPVVLTSGNVSEEPQVIGNGEARDKLSAIADGFLMHDRDIVNRLDDSVVRVTQTGQMIFRRARGFAPAPLRLPSAFHETPSVLALGGELKATFCLAANGEAILSQHIGDLENALALEDLKRNLALYREMYRFCPDVIAVDSHPDYLSSQLGRALAGELGIELIEVQHHHAHLAAVMAENDVGPEEDVLGVILDGTGHGPDGTIWGGELLVGNYQSFERAGHFQPVALPGGGVAVREPWRNLASHLYSAFGPDYQAELRGLALGKALGTKNLGVIHQMLEKRLNSPLSSSAGRLFDAVAAALGICFDRQTYEGQTGALLEALAAPFMASEQGYRMETPDTGAIDWTPFWKGLVGDLGRGVEAGRLSARFHATLINSVTAHAERVADVRGTRRVALSGGVMQNKIVLDGLVKAFSDMGLEVLVPKAVPANDGGLSLGQAVIAAAIIEGHGVSA